MYLKYLFPHTFQMMIPLFLFSVTILLIFMYGDGGAMPCRRGTLLYQGFIAIQTILTLNVNLRGQLTLFMHISNYEHIANKARLIY